MVITMAKLRMAHASTHGARKPPGPKASKNWLLNKMAIKLKAMHFMTYKVLSSFGNFMSGM